MDTTVQYVDTFELTRLGLEVSGHTAIGRFLRLIDGLPGQQSDSFIHWRLKGERNSSGQFFLHVQAEGVLMLECQRCLMPVQWRFDARNRLQVVNTEAALDDQGAQDSVLVQDPIERIVGSRRFDGLALIEDEIILAVPYVPKHDVCPTPSGSASLDPQADERRPSPFAVLDQLKKH